MDYKLAEKLDELGLQTNEARVYLALLEMGRGNVSEIAKSAQIQRTTGYDILERLSVMGLASRTVLGKKKVLYAAEPPQRLRQYLETKKMQAERNLEEARDVLPELELVHRTGSRPVIKFFEGREGIRNIYWHTLEAKSVIYSILDLSVYLPEYDQFGKDYIAERAKRGVKEKALVLKTKAALDYYDVVYKNSKRNREVTEYRWLEKQFPFVPAAEVNIYDDIVMGVLVKPGENAAFEVQNQSFANSLKIIFELAWVQAAPLPR